MGLGICVLTVLAPGGAYSQIAQDRPDLCGRSGESIPLPPGTTFSVKESSDLTIRLRNGRTATIDIDPAESVLQICPIAGERLLVFGTVAGGDGPLVWIISLEDGTKLDGIGARSPSVSPDQRWIAYRKFYPRFSALYTDEYLIYDLAKSPSGSPAAVRQMYPPTVNHAPFYGAYDENRLHTFASKAFFWSPDSRFVMFADSMGEDGAREFSVVAVDVQARALTAYTHRVDPQELCNGAEQPTLSRVEFGTLRGRLPDTRLRFDPGCWKTLRLRDEHFRKAQPGK